MRLLLAILTSLLIASSSLFSQSFSVFDIDTTNLPTMKAKFWAFDASGNQIKNLSPTDFEVTENGIVRTVTNVSCPVPTTQRLSIVFAVDVTIYNDIKNAKSVLSAWLDLIPLDLNEIAIMSYDGNSYINQDFTNDKNKLQNSINALVTHGISEDHTGALIRPITGAIAIAKNGKYKPIVIVLSSCSHLDYNREASIIDKAKKNNVTINFNIFNKYDWTPEICQNIARATGGFANNHIPLDNLSTAITSINKILSVNCNNSCKIEWQSGVSCTAGATNATIKLIPQNLADNISYQSPNTSLSKLEFSPTYVKFQNPPIGTTVSQDITVTARNSTFVVTDIKVSNTLFSISPKSFTLNSNESKTLTLSYNAQDSGYAFAQFTFETNLCEQKYWAKAVRHGMKPPQTTLKIINPNGGEMFVVGSDTVITWEGVAEDELVRLEYSIDNGTVWKYISTVRGLSYIWRNIPLPKSGRCLIRARQAEGKGSEAKLEWTALDLGIDVKWSPDGSRIASCNGSIVTILEANSLNVMRTLSGHNDRVFSVAFSPDGSLIASASMDSTIKLWRVNDGSLVRTISGHKNEVLSVSFTPDGLLIASGSSDRTIKLWRVSDGTLVNTMSGHFSKVISVVVSPDGSLIASGSYDQTIKIWRISDGSLVSTLSTNQGSIFSIDFSKDGGLIASGGSDGTIKLWQVSNGFLVQTLSASNNYIYSVAFSPDGSLIASGDLDKLVKIWRVSDGLLIHTLTGHEDIIYSLDFSPDGTLIATGSHNNEVKLWRVNDGTLIQNVAGHNQWVQSVAYSPDGLLIASGSSDGRIKLWNVNSGSLVNTLSSSSPVYSIAFSPDGLFIASGSEDKKIRLWRVSDGSLIQTLSGHNERVTSLCFSPDGLFIASGSSDYRIKLWRVSDGSLVSTFSNSGLIESVAFSPDGLILASENDHAEIMLRRVNDGSLIRTLPGVNGWHNSFAFSPDGLYIVSGSTGSSIKLWRVSDGSLVSTFSGHISQALNVAFSPDGSIIASSSDDLSIKLWRVADTTLIQTLFGHSNSILSIAFSPDGNSIIAGSKDKTVKLWSLEDIILQEDQSDSLFAIVLPELQATDIDMKQCLVNEVKDSLVTNFIHNTGTYKCSVDSIYFTGADKDAFSLVSGLPVYTVDAGKTKATEFRFMPKRVGTHTAQIVIITQADTLIQNIIGEGVQPMLKVVNNLIDFGKVNVGEPRDTIQALTIRNVGTAPLTITSTKHNLPDDKSFSTIKGGGNFTIGVGETHKMDLRFLPTSTGLTNGILEFHYNGLGSPAEILLIGKGVAPEIEIVNSEIDFGKVLLGSDSTIHKAITIANTGTGKLEITDVKITNPEFERLSGLTVFDLLPGDTLKYDLKFTPSQLAIAFADLEIYHNQANSPTKVKMKGEGIIPKIEIVNSEIDFGKILLGSDSTIHKAITIANTGTAKLTITDVKINNPDFTRLSGLTALDLLPDDTLKYDLKFTPSQVGPAAADLEIYHNQANSPTKVKMIGEGYEFTGTASATLQALNISANAGEIIELPIILKNQANLAVAKITSLKVDLSFNPTLLYPLDYPVQTIDQNTAKITIENLPSNIAIGQPLTKVKFKAALGNAEDCNLALSNAEAIGGIATINLLDGKFSLLGICHEGGTRLVNPNANIGIQSITPNPAKDKITITAKITEADTKIKLIDIAGKVIKEIDCVVDKTKAQDFTIDLTNIPAGMYFIEFKSANFSQVEKVVIEK